MPKNKHRHHARSFIVVKVTPDVPGARTRYYRIGVCQCGAMRQGGTGGKWGKSLGVH